MLLLQQRKRRQTPQLQRQSGSASALPSSRSVRRALVVAGSSQHVAAAGEGAAAERRLIRAMITPPTIRRKKAHRSTMSKAPVTPPPSSTQSKMLRQRSRAHSAVHPPVWRLLRTAKGAWLTPQHVPRNSHVVGIMAVAAVVVVVGVGKEDITAKHLTVLSSTGMLRHRSASTAAITDTIIKLMCQRASLAEQVNLHIATYQAAITALQAIIGQSTNITSGGMAFPKVRTSSTSTKSIKVASAPTIISRVSQRRMVTRSIGTNVTTVASTFARAGADMRRQAGTDIWQDDTMVWGMRKQGRLWPLVSRALSHGF